jgi:hypothetical protein
MTLTKRSFIFPPPELCQLRGLRLTSRWRLLDPAHEESGMNAGERGVRNRTIILDRSVD